MEHEIKTWQWVGTLIIVIVLIGVGIVVFDDVRSRNISSKINCKNYEYSRLDRIPPICLSYFIYSNKNISGGYQNSDFYKNLPCNLKDCKLNK